MSWTIIIQRIHILNATIREAKSFEKKFWSGIELSNLYQQSQAKRNIIIGSEKIFYNGFKEFIKLYQNHQYAPEVIITEVSRTMRISISREIEMVGAHITFLGTIGSISPYIGLLGTIWGIMHVFMSLSGMNQVTLQTVAPGIAEALTTTTISLFTAIPAVMFYNYLNQCINKLELNFDNFMEEFLSILYRQIFIHIKGNNK